MEPWKVGLGVFLNYVTATGIIFFIRYLYETGFTYVVLLTVFHYAMTWMGIAVCVVMGWMKSKKIDTRQIVLFAVGFAMGVPFCNASLRINTVGTYQIMKALLSPVSVIIQTVWYGQKFSNGVILSLVPICLGVAVTGITDVQLTFMGVFYGLGCVLISVLTQIWAEEKQKTLDLNSMQLMLYTVPLSTVVLLLAAPFTDDISSGEDGLLTFEWTPWALALLIITGAFAGVINITIYFTVKELGPVSYQVYGHVKTCSILLGGFLLFGQQLDHLNILGMAITMGGAFLYTYFKLVESSNNKRLPTPPPAATSLVINVDDADADDGDDIKDRDK